MEIVGFAKVGHKDVIIFRDDHGVLKTSDGFHDKKRPINVWRQWRK